MPSDQALHVRISGQSGAVSRRFIIGISIPILLVGLVFGWWSVTRYKHQRARAAWKTMTLEGLASFSLTNEDISGQLETLKASRGAEGAGDRPEWTGENVLIMTNDEYLVYASRHGFNSGFVDHLFLAHGSDGRWYYSTYHFCNRMAGARFDEPPCSITEFASRYAAREFDGQSDVCLQHTWPEKR